MNLMAYEGTWCLYFNENMIEDLQLERPYDLVREGSWTLDRLSEYAKAAASLNGDDSFAYAKDGSATWGISAHSNAPQKFLFCAGESSVDFDENDDPVFNYGSERFYNVISKLAVLLSGDDGQTLEANTDDFNAELGGYLHVFSTGRSLFVTGEIKAAQTLRDMTDTFGIIPFPKYDESQEDYVTDLVIAALLPDDTDNEPAARYDRDDSRSHDSRQLHRRHSGLLRADGRAEGTAQR